VTKVKELSGWRDLSLFHFSMNSIAAESMMETNQRYPVPSRARPRKSMRPWKKMSASPTRAQHCAYPPDVARGSQAETADKTCTHVGKNISVQIWHDHHSIRKRLGIRHDVKADSVK
jgi:hypothetical protein